MNVRSEAEDHDSPIEATLGESDAQHLARQIQDAFANHPTPTGKCAIAIGDPEAIDVIVAVLTRGE